MTALYDQHIADKFHKISRALDYYVHWGVGGGGGLPTLQ